MSKASRGWQVLWISLSALGAAALQGCSPSDGEEDVAASAQAWTDQCDGTATGTRGLACGVGDSNGRLALFFNGRWFTLEENEFTWDVVNGASATLLTDVRPQDLPMETIHDTSCSCATRAECIERCGQPRAPETRVYRRRWTGVNVRGRVYDVEAREVVYDERIDTSCDTQLRLTRDFVFEVRTAGVAGGAWTVRVSPKRVAMVAGTQESLNQSATALDAPSQTGAPGTLFPTPNVRYGSEVELASAVRDGAYGAAQDDIPSSVVGQATLDRLLRSDPSFPSADLRETPTGPVLMRTRRESLAANTDGTDATLFDLVRQTNVFLDGRPGGKGAGESTPGFDRPTLFSGVRNLRGNRAFRRDFDRKVTFPFLAGICGFEAGLNAYVSAKPFAQGTRKCFDGVMVTEIEAELAAGVGVGAGFGCNVLVASASAGVNATAEAIARVRTTVTNTTPPHLRAEVELKVGMSFDAYFKTRVLFWTKKWQANIARRDLVSRRDSIEIGPRSSDPNVASCMGAVDGPGTCSDPASTCDITGRCVKHSFTPSSPGEPAPSVQRLDTGPCNNLVGGRPAGACFPQAVPIRYAAPAGLPGGSAGCSGVLISSRHVLTAAHCLEDQSPGTIFVNDPSGFPLVGRAVRVHPFYRTCGVWKGDGINTMLAGRQAPYDVGVLELAGPIAGITPARLDDRDPTAGLRVTYVGYGLPNVGEKRLATFVFDGVDPARPLAWELRSPDAANHVGDSGGPFFRELGCVGAGSAPTVTATVSLVSTGPGGVTTVPSVKLNRWFIDRALSGVDTPESACCPGEHIGCTLPGGGAGYRECNPTTVQFGACTSL